jgi:hypothetical protein
MKRKNLFDLAHVCSLVLIPALAAWLLGQPLIFPSLGPSAFAIVLEGEEKNSAGRVIGGHLIGVISGIIAYEALAHGLTLAALAVPFSAEGLRIAASGAVSIGLTTALMLITRANHAPACATTLIVSLGVLPGFMNGTLIMAAVVGMVLMHRLVMSIRQ